MSNPDDYTVGWICAITTEFVAAQAFLDEKHDKPARVAPQDSNTYALGSISGHNVVIAVLPQGEYGTNSAAVVASHMLHSFPNVRVGLMVGIGGGAPTRKHDIRLGDIVVSCPHDGKGGVLQYDFGKTIQSQAFQQTGVLNQPPQVLRTAVAGLEAEYEMDGHQLDERIESFLRNKPRLRKKYSRPQPSSDRLYKSDIVHPQDTDDGCSQVCGNDPSLLVLRLERNRDKDDDPAIHYGLVASANQLMKDALVRDELAKENNVLCFEMEAAGLMNHFPCLVIRGICDYSDSHKNKEWQGFAAMAAAAYAKDLLKQISASKIEGEKKIEEVLKQLEESMHEAQSTSNQIVKTVESIRSDSRIAQIKNWLSPPDTSTNVNHALEIQLEGTCTWFLESPAFEEWKSGSRRHIWLHGIPGCGKTVLCAKVLRHLEEMDDCVTLNFFFDFSDIGKQKLDDLLRSLIFQLYKHGGEAADELDDLFKSCQGERQPGTTALTNTFQAIMKHFKKIRIVLDALDECTMRDKILAWMMAIVSNPDFDHVQLLAASRPEEEFRRNIPVWIGYESCKQLNKNFVTTDIRAYIENRLEHSPEFKKWSSFPSVLRRIKDEVGSKADGMFRWAACQLDSLEACLDREGIELALQALPRDLNETYSRILQHIPQQRKMKAIRLLQFLVHSERPLRLEEAVDVVAVRLDNGQRCFDVEDRLPRPADIMRFCPSLVSFTQGIRPGIQLAHFSVKEYLLNSDVEGFRHMEASISIIHTCLTYLTNIEDDTPEDEEFRRITKDFPLAELAADVWKYHAKLAEPADEVVTASVSFLSGTKTFRLWARLLQSTRWLPPDLDLSERSCLYLTCCEGLTETAKQLILRGADVDAHRGVLGNALQAASYCGHTEVVQMLLSKGADVNMQGGKYGNALQAASSNSHTEVVQMLLSKGADVNIQGGKYSNTLQAASYYGHIEVIQMLLSKGADTNIQGGKYGNALQAASYCGHTEVVQMLLSNRADVNIHGKYGNALQVASSGGRTNVVQMLLSSGQVDVNSRDKSGRSALSYAAEEGCESIVQMLLNTGQVDINSRDDDGRSALTWAAKEGCREIVRMLLNTGQIDIDSRDDDGQSALSWAAKEGHEAIVQMLLNTGQADANSRDNDGRSALSWAAGNGHEFVLETFFGVQLDAVAAGKNKGGQQSRFLPYGVDINSKDNDGAAPISWAARKGKVDAVYLLLSQESIDPDSRENNGSTPLLWAAWGGYEDITSLLIATRKVNINSRGWDGYTPLMCALWRFHSSVAELLLQSGSRLSGTCKATLAFDAFWWKDADKEEQLMKAIDYTDAHDVLGLQGLFHDSCDE